MEVGREDEVLCDHREDTPVPDDVQNKINHGMSTQSDVLLRKSINVNNVVRMYQVRDFKQLTYGSLKREKNVNRERIMKNRSLRDIG